MIYRIYVLLLLTVGDKPERQSSNNRYKEQNEVKYNNTKTQHRILKGLATRI
jgi:hypothetical protein